MCLQIPIDNRAQNNQRLCLVEKISEKYLRLPVPSSKARVSLAFRLASPRSDAGSPPSMDGAQDLAAGEVCDDYTPQQISDQLVLAKATKVLHK